MVNYIINTVWDISNCQKCPHFGELGKERFHCTVKPLNCNVCCNCVIVNILPFTISHDHHVNNDFLLLRELNGVLNTESNDWNVFNGAS